jgi:FtsZ-interacting cell division protein ZipA
MVTVLIIIAVLVLAAIAFGVYSRRRAAEQARIARERAIISRDLDGHRQESDANALRAGEVRQEATQERRAAEDHLARAEAHRQEAAAHQEKAEQLEQRFERATGAAQRHGERAEDAARRLDELEGGRRES